MNGNTAWAVVAQRELSVRLRDKTFIGSTLLSLAILVGVFGFQAWQASQDTTYRVAVTSESAPMGQVLERAAGDDDQVEINLVEVADAGAGRAAVADDSADVWLAPAENGWELTSKQTVDSQLADMARQAISQSVMSMNAERAGTDLDTLRQGSTVTTEVLDGRADQQQAGEFVGFVMAFLFYVGAAMFGMYLAMSVTEEKQSRIVEIIATSIPLRHLLLGKLLGSVVLAVSQMLLYAVVAIIGVSFTPMGDLLPGFTSSLAWFIAFFIAGFTMIAALYAVSGALASRQEDIQSTSMPVTILLMVMFFGAVFARGAIVEVLAWVPPFSAVLQPMRLVTGEATWWEALISLGLLVVAAFAVIVLAERIYRRALMQTSGKLSLKEAWNAEV